MSRRKKEEDVPVVPKEARRPVQKNQIVDLLGIADLLHRILNPSLCEEVFKKVRHKEREGDWTLHALVEFWTAVRLKEPVSIKQGVEETRKSRGRDKLWPRVMADTKALYDRCYALRPDFFQALFEAFIERLAPEAPATYASWISSLQEQFGLVLAVDGSKLDAIAHRLKLLWNERGVVLPGCMTVFYDMFRGIPRRMFFYANAAEAELTRGMDCLSWIPRGTLLVGDRLYCSIQFFAAVIEAGLHGVFRLNGTIKVRRIKVRARHQGRRESWKDVLVEVGGTNGLPILRLRLIQYRGYDINGRRISRDILTSVLDPKKLTVEQILMLYRLRWSIERMFFSLKETLCLSALYGCHPNLVAMQVYTTGLVYAAFRVGQAKIALQAKVLPEQLSPAKLFPLLAEASVRWAESQLVMLEVTRSNPGVALREPNWKKMKFAYARLGSIVVETRRGRRRKRRYCVSRRRWKSMVHVPGGRKFLRLATVG